jgi:hypothetical protein
MRHFVWAASGNLRLGAAFALVTVQLLVTECILSVLQRASTEIAGAR